MDEGGSLIKLLASSNKPTRDKALRILLNTWLPSQSQLSDDYMKKLWKGLFYCVWHADKLPVQTQLINRISSLLPTLPLPLSLNYFSVFFLTMRREWSGIDALRLDKFYLLIRRFLHFSFLLLKNNYWDSDLCVRLIGLLEERTFLANDKFQGNGVNYHIASIFLEELRPFLPVKAETLEVLFAPFVSVMGKLPDKVLLRKIKVNVFDVLLTSGKKFFEYLKMKNSSEDGVVDSCGNNDDSVVLGTIGLVMGWSTKFYELGSSPDCCQGNRKVLFGMHEEFLKLEKEVTSSGISIPDVNVNDDDEDVPNLVPIDSKLDVSDGKPLKKCKLGKNASGSNKKVKEKKKEKKKKTKKNGNSTDIENKDTVMTNSENSNDEQTIDENLVTLNESVISNLQMQFERVAAEVGLDNDDGSDYSLQPRDITVNGTVSKKRKRSKSMEGRPQKLEVASQPDTEGGMIEKSGEKSAKKVRFSMKNNLIWKPHSPLPPQCLRLPPSVTPRGSALKKGLSPGPIREMPLESRKVKRRVNPAKKGRKVMKSIFSGAKRPKKLKSLSA